MKTKIEQLLDVLSGHGEAAVRKELRRPHSEAGELLRAIQAAVGNAHRVDLLSLAQAVVPADDAGLCGPQADTAGLRRPASVENPEHADRRPASQQEGPRGEPLTLNSRPKNRATLRAAATSSTLPLPVVHLVVLPGTVGGAAGIHGQVEWIPQKAAGGRAPQHWWATLRFPLDATDYCPGNEKSALAAFDGLTVCLKVCGRPKDTCILVKLSLNAQHDLVSNRHLVTLSRPLAEMEDVRVSSLDTRATCTHLVRVMSHHLAFDCGRTPQ